VNRIDLRDRREQRLLSLDKAALGLQCAAGDAADWRLDTRISDIEFGRGKGGLRGFDSGYRDLVTVANEAWEMGVPRGWLPFCEDNADYFCLEGNIVRYWSHNGDTDEHWPDLGTWIDQVWIGHQ
jgi:hypothetical protein